jgi:hypothetical protein
VPTFADRECRVVSAADPYARNIGSIDKLGYHVKIFPGFFQLKYLSSSLTYHCIVGAMVSSLLSL